VEEGHVVKCLLTAEPARGDSYMFHAVNARWALLHGEAMGIPHYLVEVSGAKEREVEELGDALARFKRECGVEGVVTGAVASRYQKERVDRLAARLGLAHVAPLWGRDQGELLLAEASAEEFIMVAVMAMGPRRELARREGREARGGEAVGAQQEVRLLAGGGRRRVRDLRSSEPPPPRQEGGDTRGRDPLEPRRMGVLRHKVGETSRLSARYAHQATAASRRLGPPHLLNILICKIKILQIYNLLCL
jgi:Predicted ATPases of PP-loop superfamily